MIRQFRNRWSLRDTDVKQVYDQAVLYKGDTYVLLL